MKLGTLALIAGALLLVSKAKAPENASPTPAMGAAVLQAATGNKNIVATPIAVIPVGATVATLDVPSNISVITDNVRIEGITAPIANIPGGQLITNNELSALAAKAQDEAYRVQQLAAQQAADAQAQIARAASLQAQVQAATASTRVLPNGTVVSQWVAGTTYSNLDMWKTQFDSSPSAEYTQRLANNIRAYSLARDVVGWLAARFPGSSKYANYWLPQTQTIGGVAAWS